jgi:hypothetical protein
MACAEYTSIIDWAKELNALIVANEHRYFIGPIIPTTSTVALSPITKGVVSDPKDPLALGYGDWVNSSMPNSSGIL